MSVVDRMIEILKAKGWVKLYYEDKKNGGCCILGAYHVVTETDYMNMDSAETAEIAQVIREQYPDRSRAARTDVYGTITEFNDHPETVFEDVLTVLEKAHHV